MSRCGCGGGGGGGGGGLGVVRIASLIILLSALLSILTQLLTFNFSYDPRPAHHHPHHHNHSIIPDSSDPVTIGAKNEHVFVFLQVSDLHLSINFDPGRGPDFRIFCTKVIDSIRPSVTLVTGDLTDARTKRLMAGQQFESEWQQYFSIVSETGVSNKTLWLDMRGNHDDFGVLGPNESNNFYKRYSVQGPQHRSHYSQSVRNGSETYSFVAVDACLTPGPNRPFNTVGFLRPADLSLLKLLKARLPPSNLTVWFGHYPTRAITGPGHPDGLCDLIDGPYLSGHVHMLDLFAVQGQGFLDAELADWRAKRKFRVAAVDHGLFSFSDVVLNEWPIILITNPKPAAFQMPMIEPMHRVLASTHVRALVFSPDGVASASMKIGDGEEWTAMERVTDSDLFVAPWDPEKYVRGLHRITIKASDVLGNERNMSHEFSFDGSRPPSNLKSKMIMGYPHQSAWGTFFILSVLLNVLPLLCARLLHWLPASRRLRARAGHKSIPVYLSPLAKVYMLTCVDRVFLPALCVPLFLTFGPWMVGEVVPGHYAVCFVFGMFVEGGSFLPGGVSYVLGALQVLLIHLPFTLVLAHSVHVRYRQLLARESSGSGDTPCGSVFHCRHLIAWLILALHFFLTIVYADGYGAVAWLTGFGHTWTLALNLHLWFTSMRLQMNDFTPALPQFRSAAQTSAPTDPHDPDKQPELETTDLLKERTD